MPELIRNYCFVLVEILCCKIFLIGDVALREKKLYENARLEIQAENQWLMYQKMIPQKRNNGRDYCYQ